MKSLKANTPLRNKSANTSLSRSVKKNWLNKFFEKSVHPLLKIQAIIIKWDSIACVFYDSLTFGEIQRVWLPKEHYTCAMLVNDRRTYNTNTKDGKMRQFKDRNSFLIVLFHYILHEKPCKLVKFTRGQNFNWDSNITQLPIVHPKGKSAKFKNCFILNGNITFLVTSFRTIFFDEDLQELKQLFVQSIDDSIRCVDCCRADLSTAS